MTDSETTEARPVEQHGYAPPADSVEIVLVRHGASAGAQPNRRFELVDGHGNPPLSERGKEQAHRVAAALAGEDFAAIFATGLLRTEETAAPLAAKVGKRITQVPELREVLLGELEGGGYRIKVAEGDPIVAETARRERWDVIPGAESPEAFSDRLRAGIAKIVAAVPVGTTAVAFLHAAVIGDLCSMATGSRPFAFLAVDNCSISSLVVHGDGSWLLRSFNETRHLDAPAGPVG
jgi:2,3-bisphosphoglycerate-dependent phosphoglycerate mutase